MLLQAIAFLIVKASNNYKYRINTANRVIVLFVTINIKGGIDFWDSMKLAMMCVHAGGRAGMCACGRSCVRAFVRACVLVYVSVH